MRQGEIDIVEGVNDQMPNLSSLHTSPGVYRGHRHLSVSWTDLFARVHNARSACPDWVRITPTFCNVAIMDPPTATPSN